MVKRLSIHMSPMTVLKSTPNRFSSRHAIFQPLLHFTADWTRLPVDTRRPFVSDFVDFSIYVDAEEPLLKQWYKNASCNCLALQ